MESADKGHNVARGDSGRKRRSASAGEGRGRRARRPEGRLLLALRVPLAADAAFGAARALAVRRFDDGGANSGPVRAGRMRPRSSPPSPAPALQLRRPAARPLAEDQLEGRAVEAELGPNLVLQEPLVAEMH